jgi:Ca2+-binding EF-hand superfamily protein
MRKRISCEKGVNLRKAFDAMDWLNRGFITSNEFKRVFEWQNEVSEVTKSMK